MRIGNQEAKQNVAETTDMEELENLCKPVVEWIRKHYHPHAQVIIGFDRVRIVEDVISVPFN